MNGLSDRFEALCLSSSSAGVSVPEHLQQKYSNLLADWEKVHEMASSLRPLSDTSMEETVFMEGQSLPIPPHLLHHSCLFSDDIFPVKESITRVTTQTVHSSVPMVTSPISPEPKSACHNVIKAIMTALTLQRAQVGNVDHIESRLTELQVNTLFVITHPHPWML